MNVTADRVIFEGDLVQVIFLCTVLLSIHHHNLKCNVAKHSQTTVVVVVIGFCDTKLDGA